MPLYEIRSKINNLTRNCQNLTLKSDETTQEGITKASNSNGGLLTMLYGASANFVEKALLEFLGLPVGKRTGILLKKKVTSGIILFRGPNKLATLYKVRKATVDTNENVWLGTSSNNASFVRLKTIPDNSTANVVVVVDKSSLPTNLDIPIGPIDIDKKDTHLAKFFEDDRGRPLDNEIKIAVRMPTILPLPFQSTIKTGALNQGAFDSLENIDTRLMSFWANAINTYDPDLQKALLHEDCKKYLPHRPAIGHGYIDSPFIKLSDIDDDDECINDAAEELRKECEKIVKKRMARDIEDEISQKMSTRRSSQQSLSGMVIGDTIEADANAAGLKTAHEGKPQYTSEDILNSRISALGMHYDPEKRTATLPILSEFLDLIGNTTKQSQREAVWSTMETIQGTLSKNEHFLYRNIDFPEMSKLGLSYLGQGTWSSDPIENLDMTTSNGFVINMILPDSPAMMKSKAEAEDVNAAEDALNEHHSKKSKIDTSFSSLSEISNLSHLLSAMANSVGIFHLYFKMDVNDLDSLPTMVSYVVRFSDRLTQLESRIWYKKNRAESVKLFYYVLNQICTMQSCYVRTMKDVVVTGRILRKDLDNIPVDSYAIAQRIFDDTMIVLDRAFLGSAEVPSTPLWKNSPAKKRADEKDLKKMYELMSPRDKAIKKEIPRKDIDKDRRNNNCDDRRSGKLSNNGSSEGWIKCKNNNLSLPGLCFNKDYKLCKSNVRDNEKCHWGDKCNNDHSHFAGLTRDRQKAMVKSVDRNNTQEFVGVDDKLLAELREEVKKE